MSKPLVLSLFPGIGLLDLAFEEEGFAVVRGPDLLWGGDIRKFSVPAGRFDGVIGGPPCQAFSRLVHIVKAKGQTPKPNLIPEYERIVGEARPEWFVMENVTAAPEPVVPGYHIASVVLNNRDLGAEQNRERRFSFGCNRGGVRFGRWVAEESLHSPRSGRWSRAVVATSSKEGALAKSQTELRKGNKRRTLPGQQPRRTVEECARLQGLPDEWIARLNASPLTTAGKYLVIGNGVPFPMGRAVARAVRKAMGYESEAA